MTQHSGLQLQILHLYRQILRISRRKDLKLLNDNFMILAGPSVAHARIEFRRQAESVKRSDFKTIEHLIRSGQKYVKLLKMDGVKVSRKVE